MGKRIDLTGQKFNRYTVIEFAFVGERRVQKWKCRCDCGSIRNVAAPLLKNGGSKSCGCHKREVTIARNKKHGESDRGNISTEYTTYHSLKGRCYAINNKKYKNYGGRGIRVCDRWLGDSGFNNFLSDMGRKPSPEMSIERLDVNGDYSKENCVWGTDEMQAHNKTNSRHIVLKGETKTITQWCKELNVCGATVRKRIKDGWTEEDAFYKPVNKNLSSKFCFGKSFNINSQATSI